MASKLEIALAARDALTVAEARAADARAAFDDATTVVEVAGGDLDDALDDRDDAALHIFLAAGGIEK